jgi:hypothetical protein
MSLGCPAIKLPHHSQRGSEGEIGTALVAGLRCGFLRWRLAIPEDLISGRNQSRKAPQGSTAVVNFEVADPPDGCLLDFVSVAALEARRKILPGGKETGSSPGQGTLINQRDVCTDTVILNGGTVIPE